MLHWWTSVWVWLHPPVKVIVVVLRLSPEVEEHQRYAESRHEQSKAGAFQLSGQNDTGFI